MEVEARMRSWMAIALRRILYFSMSFSKVGSRALEATYWAEVVVVRRRRADATRGLAASVLKIWAAIFCCSQSVAVDLAHSLL